MNFWIVALLLLSGIAIGFFLTLAIGASLEQEKKKKNSKDAMMFLAWLMAKGALDEKKSNINEEELDRLLKEIGDEK